MSELMFQLPAEIVEAIAERAAELVLAQLASVSAAANESGPRWLYGAQAAADHLGWPVGRVQKLTAAKDAAKRMPHHRIDGEQRVSYRTDELDAWLDQFYEGPRFLSNS